MARYKCFTAEHKVLREHPLRTSPREWDGVTTMGTYGTGEGVKVNKDVPFKY